MHKISLTGSDLSFACAERDTVMRAALRAGVGMSYSCNVGSCGNCRFELVAGAVDHLRADAPAWTEKDRKRGRWLGCQARPLSDCVVKFRADPDAVPVHRPVQRSGVLVSRDALNHDMAEFAFRIDGEPGFLPGQYALLSVPGVAGARVYSMCNLPDEDIWRFQIKRVPGGAATTLLFDNLRPGDAIALDGPYGLAHLRPDIPRDIVLLAGGSGLSPMVSIARAAVAAPGLQGRTVHFYFGGRGPADLAPAACVTPLVSDRFRLVTAISDPALAGNWAGPIGFIHDIALADLGPRLAECEIYFAGPPAMAAAIRTSLHAQGVPAGQIHFDEFY
ncbi:2Fe-2S iron-sulfur cluster binding domain-containing protein [Fertoebacter nigrum]|uniref:2Fe-2S iron-sulfur cluster binding domain-containing protein n=1 Tax=Fertoeibacter niger TaxID=2656921 RepID=A0A8X8KQE1_9RHOB|nr:2Fe-2S iron-sulfur cluster-binding protein [Fertoeibacter niger]NUB45861.1 2Fe-2S iron-sulfur cluster binding domain-containing protein [Fertoeibacter niger]